MAGKIVADTLKHSTAGSLDTQYVVNGSEVLDEFKWHWHYRNKRHA